MHRPRFDKEGLRVARGAHEPPEAQRMVQCTQAVRNGDGVQVLAAANLGSGEVDSGGEEGAENRIKLQLPSEHQIRPDLQARLKQSKRVV